MAETANGSEKGVSKMDAVRAGLRELGRKAKPLKLRAFIKEKFDLDMTPDHISNYKSTILKGKGKGKGGKRGRPAKNTETLAAAKSTAANAKGRSGLAPEDVENVKTLVQRFGSDSIKKLIDVLVE